MTKYEKSRKGKGGSLLLELLIVIALLAVILSFGANAVFLSLRSNKASAERDGASALATEALEAARSVADENWQNIYTLTKGSQYHPAISASKWVLTSGSEVITINNVAYTRYVVIDNVSRDTATRNIETAYVGADDDPGTQKATATVSWGGGLSVSAVDYFARWKNNVCPQTAWTTGATGNTVKLCTDASYDVKDAAVNVTGGLHLQ
jgi:type II secretory pathway pseudopilin PulG